MEERKLTEKQKRFIDFYIESGNATDAAIRAGYSKKTADVIAAQNLVKLKVEISARNSILESARIADMDEINEFWSEIMRDKEIKVQDRLKASELRARVQGAFFDRIGVEITKDTAETIADIEAHIAKRRGE